MTTCGGCAFALLDAMHSDALKTVTHNCKRSNGPIIHRRSRRIMAALAGEARDRENGAI